MTREEAITIIDCERPYASGGCGANDEEIEEAFNMAINALTAIDKIKAEVDELPVYAAKFTDCIEMFICKTDVLDNILDKYIKDGVNEG